MIKRIIQRYYVWWFTKGLPFKWKVHYFFHHIVAYFRMIFTNKRYVNYLGRRIYFDNSSVPFWLMVYPSEILNLFHNIDDDVESFLDIGGNIGQTSLTVLPLTQIKQIDLFEPNQEIFSLLEKNVTNVEGVHPYNFGIGKESKEDFYFTPGKSGNGSMIEDIDKKGVTDSLKQIEVELVSDVAKVTGRSYYDVVKIDVEGYEYDVIKNMEGIKFKYLFIELTGPKRVQTYKYSELMNEIYKKYGEFDLVSQDDYDVDSVATELLLKFYP